MPPPLNPNLQSNPTMEVPPAVQIKERARPPNHSRLSSAISLFPKSCIVLSLRRLVSLALRFMLGSGARTIRLHQVVFVLRRAHVLGPLFLRAKSSLAGRGLTACSLHCSPIRAVNFPSPLTSTTTPRCAVCIPFTQTPVLSKHESLSIHFLLSFFLPSSCRVFES